VINQSFLVCILMVLLIILFGLILIYIFVYEPKVDDVGGPDGELGTLCIFCSENKVGLDITYFNITNNNATAQVGINWSSGEISDEDFNGLFIDFSGIPNGCNYTTSDNLPEFGVDINYSWDYDLVGVDCVEFDFSNLTGVSAYAEVNIHLTQTTIPIPNINFYAEDSRDNLINFDKYFNALTEINYSIIESPENDKIHVVINNVTKNLSISALDNTWFGVQRFNLTAISDGDQLDALNNGNNLSFTITIIDGVREVPNKEPEFDFDGCESFSWVENTNKTIDMDYCWDDADGDNLIYEYGDLHNYEDNLSVTRLSGNRLKFAPDINFNGSTYLYFYANDSKVRVSQRVNIMVLGAFVNVSDDEDDEDDEDDADANDRILEIKSSNPSNSRIIFSIGENKNFVISAENYENIEWYVDGKLKREGGLSYRFEETTPGKYHIQVKIINGIDVKSKTWEVTIAEEPIIGGGVSDVNIGQVVFYLIIIVLVIIILLVIWLFIVEKNKKNKKVDLGFGVSVVPNHLGRNSSSNQFNIPKE